MDNLSEIASQIRTAAGSSAFAAGNPVRVFIQTMGCPKNEVDSNSMADSLRQAGAVIVDGPSEADCIIVNTCSFIQSATEESIEAIFDMVAVRNERGANPAIVVSGCMPSRYGDDLATSLPEASSFVAVSEEDRIVDVVGSLFPGRLGTDALQTAAQSLYAYVKISDGCDRYCSFCTIPFIRGRYHSYPCSQIERDVAQSIERGAREVVLIAQDTGRWGEDLEQPSSLADLLDSLARAHPDTWFRVMYIQPEGVTDALLDVMALTDNVCSYLDIPFQHCNADLLRTMNRQGSAEAYASLVSRIRKKVPDVALRTTLIAGFPGETDRQFDDLCDFVAQIEFDYVGVFPYSAEEGTRAAQLPGQVPADEISYRASRLRDIADTVSNALISNRIGREMNVLVLGQEEDGQLFGRAMCQAPDVDGVVYLKSGSPGIVRKVTIEDTLLYEMEAE